MISTLGSAARPSTEKSLAAVCRVAGVPNQWIRPWFTRPARPRLIERKVPTWVEIIYAHAGMARTLIDCATAAGAEGLVIAGVGSGNFHADARTAAAEAAARGIAIVRASRTGGGIVERSVEVDDERFGFIAAGDLNPQKARVLLKLALTRSRSPAAIQEMFDQY